MRSHTWMHLGLLAAIGVVFGLNALGVAVPIFLTYLIVAACPLMMVFMMVGMGHDEASGHEEREPAVTPARRES